MFCFQNKAYGHHLYYCECIGEPSMSDEGDAIGEYPRDEIMNELNDTKPTDFFDKFFSLDFQNLLP